MTDEKSIYIGLTSGNQLKVIACITMFFDHIGAVFFPGVTVLRIIGRISMPLFAFTFGEGCYYTRGKAKHFVLVLVCGIFTSIAMSIAMERIYGNILITFSFSALIIYAIDGIKHSAAEKKKKGIVMYSFALFGAVLLATVVCCFSPIDIDYGIAGVTLPVCVRLLDFRLDGASGRRLTAFYSLLLFSVNLLILTAIYGTVQSFCLFSLPLIMAYSGKRGKYNLKSAFYAFYPVHLAIIAMIYLMIHPSYLETIF